MTSVIEDFNEIIVAVMNLQCTFQQRNMTPFVIQLSSQADGRQLAQLASQFLYETGDARATEPNNKTFATNQIEIAGTIVRWPIARSAQEGKSTT